MFAAVFFHGFQAAKLQQGFAACIFRRHASRHVECRLFLQMKAQLFIEIFFPLIDRMLSPPETHASCSFAAGRPRGVQARSRIRAKADERRSHSANSFSSWWRPVFVSE